MLEFHLCKLKPPLLNNSSHFCLRISTSPIALPPETQEETLAQVFFCEFYEISRNTFFTEHLWMTNSVVSHDSLMTGLCGK